jgi:hypothetical protein
MRAAFAWRPLSPELPMILQIVSMGVTEARFNTEPRNHGDARHSTTLGAS